MSEHNKPRLLGRKLARELSHEEIEKISGGGCDPTFTAIFLDFDNLV